MATLPEKDLGAAVLGTKAGTTADAGAAVVRQRFTRIPGADALAETQAIRVLVREVGPFPLHDEYEALDWRSQALELAAARATSGEEATWDIKKVVDKVEEHARRRAEEQQQRAQALADANAQAEQAAAEAQARAEQGEQDHLARWEGAALEIGICNVLGIADVDRARRRFGEDLEWAERIAAFTKAEREAREAMAERRSARLAIALGGAAAVGLLAGRSFPETTEEITYRTVYKKGEPIRRPYYREVKTFGWGAAVGCSVLGGLGLWLMSDWLLQHGSHMGQGASMVRNLGGLGRRVA